MPSRNLLAAAGALVVTLALCAGAVVLASPNDSDTPASAPTTTTREPTCAESQTPPLPEGVSCSRVAKDFKFAAAVHYVEQVAFVDFTEAAWANHLAELEAARRPVYSSGGGATGECGGATNGADAFIARESGGSASVWNQQGSSAWGCYQIIDSTWNSSCSDLGVHGQADAAAQAACASRLPLSAWSASGPT